MRNIRFWIPTIVGIAVMLASYWLIILTSYGPESHAGAGLVLIPAFYPLPSILAISARSLARGDAFVLQLITRFAFALAMLQFPTYGFIISYARLKQKRWLNFLRGVVWIHVIAVLAVSAIALIHEFL